MKQSNFILFWYVKSPKGNLLNSTNSKFKKDAILNFTKKKKNWDEFYKKGYRCIKVGMPIIFFGFN